MALSCENGLILQEGSSEFLDSFLELSPQQLAIIAADPGGSRVMEALLETPSANAKAKKKLLKKLSGYYGAISSTPSGNFLVEKCYGFAVSNPRNSLASQSFLARVLTRMPQHPHYQYFVLSSFQLPSCPPFPVPLPNLSALETRLCLPNFTCMLSSLLHPCLTLF